MCFQKKIQSKVRSLSEIKSLFLVFMIILKCFVCWHQYTYSILILWSPIQRYYNFLSTCLIIFYLFNLMLNQELCRIQNKNPVFVIILKCFVWWHDISAFLASWFCDRMLHLQVIPLLCWYYFYIIFILLTKASAPCIYAFIEAYKAGSKCLTELNLQNK